jgi:hypothetical protein
MHFIIGAADVAFHFGKREQNLPFQHPQLFRPTDPTIEEAVAAELTIVMPDGVHPNVELPGWGVKNGVDGRE